MKKDSKQMLFEMMHKVGGLPLKENNFPNHPIIEDGYWDDLNNKAKKLYGIDNVNIVGFNTNKPKVVIYKSGFKPIIVWEIKPNQLEYIKNPKHYEYITNWLLNEAIPHYIDKFIEKEKQIRLSNNLSISQKVELIIRLIEKANEEYYNEHNKIYKNVDVNNIDKLDKRNVLLMERIRRKYEDKIEELFTLEVYLSSEWKQSKYGNSGDIKYIKNNFSSTNPYTLELNFGELVFAI